MSRSNALLFTYETSNIYQADVQTLRPGSWLNDNILSFYLDYLQHDTFKKSGSKFRFVSPATTFILMHEDDESDLSDALEGCDIDDKTEYVFFPLNNNLNVTKMGGSHWNLVVLDVKHQKFFSLDSMARSTSASAEAKQLAVKLTAPLRKILPQSSPDSASSLSSSSGSKSFPISSVNCPQQNNSSDCGVYVLTFSETLATYLSTNSADTLDNSAVTSYLNSNVTSQAVAKKRESIQQIIQKQSK